MAAPAGRPGRTLGVFALGVALLYGLVALAGVWTPALGLDLQGGQRIILRAVDDDVSRDALKEAAGIVNSRVNGSGVTEAEVSTQGDTNVVVEIPGESNQALVDTVQRQAQLRFRLVACSTASPGPCATAGVPSQPDLTANRPAPAGLLRAGETPGSPSPSPTPTTTPSRQEQVEQALAWANRPTPDAITAFSQASCPPARPVVDDPDTFLVTCDEAGTRYLLSEPVVEGTELADASAGQEQRSIQWAVNLELEGGAKDAFGQVSQQLVGSQGQFAIVLDGSVISAPSMQAVITDGRASITGNFNEQSANSLATSLRFGALPVAFEDNPRNDTVGPSLAGNQLSVGLWAGAAGLGLVMLYCLLYYRGLGLVVIGSLLVAAVITYAMACLMSKGAGFTLSLPGIAGLMVAVGITADSFVVFFERIRDEMRDGKSMRVAVDAGWKRARNTCLAADTVALTAALVLYIFAIDDVRGFAFTLGLVTLIDLVVLFWFTKPLVSWLGHFAFFHRGHRLSGLDAGNLGIDRVPGVSTGGVA
jgi:preprotein translocase subunit SecD